MSRVVSGVLYSSPYQMSHACITDLLVALLINRSTIGPLLDPAKTLKGDKCTLLDWSTPSTLNVKMHVNPSRPWILPQRHHYPVPPQFASKWTTHNYGLIYANPRTPYFSYFSPIPQTSRAFREGNSAASLKPAFSFVPKRHRTAPRQSPCRAQTLALTPPAQICSLESRPEYQTNEKDHFTDPACCRTNNVEPSTRVERPTKSTLPCV